jgi:hypothetical protein
MEDGCWEFAKGYGRVALVSWKHHKCQHYQEKENGVKEKTERCRASLGICNSHPTQKLIHDFIGFWVCTQEKYQGTVKTVLYFQEDVHLLVLFVRRDFLCFRPPVFPKRPYGSGESPLLGIGIVLL